MNAAKRHALFARTLQSCYGYISILGTRAGSECSTKLHLCSIQSQPISVLLCVNYYTKTNRIIEFVEPTRKNHNIHAGFMYDDGSEIT